MPNLVVLGQTTRAYLTDICRTYLTPPVSRVSRALKVIGIDTGRSATHDFLLVIQINSGHISYRFRVKNGDLC